jgi:hypothetical protein
LPSRPRRLEPPLLRPNTRPPKEALGADRPLDRVSARELGHATNEAWGTSAPATWNRHVATLRSFAGCCRRRGWLEGAIADGLERRREPVDRTGAIPYGQLDRLCRRDDLAVREKEEIVTERTPEGPRVPADQVARPANVIRRSTTWRVVSGHRRAPSDPGAAD